MDKVKDELAEKGITIRLTNADWEYVCRRGNHTMANKALINIITQLRRIEGYSMSEISGYFEPKEWKFFALILNKYFVGTKEELMQRISDTENLKSKVTMTDVDIKVLLGKVQQLNAVHIMAIMTRVQDYWRSAILVDIDEWALAL